MRFAISLDRLSGGLLLALGLALSACGGGGGGGSGDSSAEPAGNQADPTLKAAFTADAFSADAPFTASFDASGSTGNISRYAWSFGDGNQGEGARISHRFAQSGSYRVVLSVTGATGQVASAAAVVTVAEPGDDLLYRDQWHLTNTGQAGVGGTSASWGEDINVLPVWSRCGEVAGCRGEGIRIAVVDDGLELGHEDLSANVVNFASHDYRDGSSDPTPPSRDYHGTAVAGIVAARDGNGRGGRGVAPRAGLLGYNLLQNPTSSNMADAMTRGAADIHISNNSWGPLDGRGQLAAAGSIWRSAVETGLRQGRGGRGVVYVWAAGNGAAGSPDCPGCVDNSNYDGYANFHGVMAVAAVDAAGRQASYSERGANLWVSAPGGEPCGTSLAVTTTDLMGAGGLNTGQRDGEAADGNYTRCMNGTSAAAPLVAGVAALTLQANPALSWRDVRMILARSARRNDPDDSEWVLNGAGLAVSHRYGFGVVNAEAAVNLARNWPGLPPMVSFQPLGARLSLPIPDDDPDGVSHTLSVAGSNISRIEFVEIHFSAEHPRAGDLEISLTHLDTGTTSVLAEPRQCLADSCGEYSEWRFGSARHLLEAADGQWRLTVRDRRAGASGAVTGWHLVFHGH